MQLIGMNADAVLVGGADETEEPGRIYSYLNLNRAFLELLAGAELYCLHRNRWWQTAEGPRLDAGRDRRRARVRRRDRGDRARQAEPGVLRRGDRGARRRPGA